jgi:hypothetical protein
MSDPKPPLQKMRDALRGDASTAVSVAFTFLVMAGLLWSGTSLNRGYEAPEVVVIPTVWAAAIIGGVVLATVFTFLRYVNARAGDEGGMKPESRTPDDSGPDSENRTVSESTGPEPQQGRQVGKTVDVSGDETAGGSVKSPENAERRAKDNFPEWMQNEGNEQAGQSTTGDSGAVPPNQAGHDPTSEQTRTRSSGQSRISDPDSRGEQREGEPATATDDRGANDESAEAPEDESQAQGLTESYFRNLRQSVVRNEFRR